MKLKPSEIFYSQSSIDYKFGRRTSHSSYSIGETLDKLCDGLISISAIPKMSVFKKDGKWFTADNRRLWIFRHLQGAGKCTEIEVEVSDYESHSRKFTTNNGGVSVVFKRGSPGGKWCAEITPVTPQVPPSDETVVEATETTASADEENVTPTPTAAMSETNNVTGMTVSVSTSVVQAQSTNNDTHTNDTCSHNEEEISDKEIIYERKDNILMSNSQPTSTPNGSADTYATQSDCSPENEEIKLNDAETIMTGSIIKSEGPDSIVTTKRLHDDTVTNGHKADDENEVREDDGPSAKKQKLSL